MDLKLLLMFVAGMVTTPAIAYATYKVWVYTH